MKSQLVAVMERRKEPELVKHRGEEICNQFSQIYDVIARRAFDIVERHGRSPGHELDDWFRAESELLHPVPLNSEAGQCCNVLSRSPPFSSR
jgi:hypothetical protein